MSLEFIFAPLETTDWDNLQQGDLLRKTDELLAALRQAHRYYAEADSYKYFMVLTQSCDLVRRERRPPNSRYITIAAARSADIVIERMIEKYRRRDLEISIPVCDRAHEVRARQMLERLLHNTEDDYFFIKGKSHSNVEEDLCVFLRLAIPLRIAHYDVCLKSKVAQLADIFQAKVGWMVGNIYSRIGTPDLEEAEPDPKEFKKQFLNQMLYSRSAWMNSVQVAELKRRIQDWKQEHPHDELGESEVLGMIRNLPDIMETLAERVIQQLKSNGLISRDDVALTRAKSLLANDKIIRSLINAS